VSQRRCLKRGTIGHDQTHQLRLRNAELLAKAPATLIRAGRGDELKRAHTAAVMRQARATVARAKEKWRCYIEA
jgi:glycerol dehydrogenase-like iron-containing ADH family enzyme